jgi:hypothetical protein
VIVLDAIADLGLFDRGFANQSFLPLGFWVKTRRISTLLRV